MSEPGVWLEEPGVFVLPAEELGPEGLDAEFRAGAERATGLPAAWFNRFDEAWRLYWSRTTALASADPSTWFPPRCQSVVITLEGAAVRPYFQPFHRSSWLLEQSDFDPDVPAEFGAFLILQVERMGLLQAVGPALAANLSYWVQRSVEEVAAFREGARRATRSDAPAYQALAEALPWIRRLTHPRLRPARLAETEPVSILAGSGLEVPKRRSLQLDGLLRGWARTAAEVAEAHWRRHATPAGSGRELCAWLANEAPPLLVTGEGGAILWDPLQPRALDALRSALGPLTAAAAPSLLADLRLVANKNQLLLDALVDPSALPAPDPRAADQDGLSYMHLERRLVAYNLNEPGMRRLEEPSPPFERAMLGARTVHEWGHLVTSAGWVDVPAEQAGTSTERLAALAAAFAEVLSAAPAHLRRAAAPVHRRLARPGEDEASTLARFGLGRVEDFQSNLFSQPYLSPLERETYVRNNMRSLVLEFPPEGVFAQLARYAYEVQYLRFSATRDAAATFERSTWFPHQFLSAGVLDRERWERLRGAFGDLLDLYVVDPTRVR